MKVRRENIILRVLTIPKNYSELCNYVKKKIKRGEWPVTLAYTASPVSNRVPLYGLVARNSTTLNG